MKTKKFLFAATAILAFASCSEDSYVGDQSLQEANENRSISFNLNTAAVTRATGEGAATALSNQFIVWGEKNEADGTKATAAGTESTTRSGDLVFPNYQVNWVNLAHSTTSNSSGWEYVGYTHSSGYQSHITPNKTAEQTIKYWDMAANPYVFTAVSAKPDDITGGKVSISKTTSNASSVYNKGYSVVVTDEADLAHLYFSDRVEMAPGTNPVTLTFRNSISQVRVGMYETVPGYDVKVTKFYYATTANPAFSAMTTENTANFVANVPSISPDIANSKTSVAGTFNVTYFPQSTENDAAGITNHPTVSFTPTTSTDSKNYIFLGTGVYNTKLNDSSAKPTFDQGGNETTAGGFTTVFPQEDNSTNLKLKIDYQLSNTTTGETINLTAKTAEVPAQYLQWKPNYKYTYIFKISDNDLIPITFDAVQIEAENGNVEYITTVTEPSITTYAKASDVITDNEYKEDADIYVVVMEGSANPALLISGDINAKLYTAKLTYTGSAGSGSEPSPLQEITELSVANVLATASPVEGVYSQTDANDWKLSVTTNAGLSAITKIPAAASPTGSDLSINGVKFKPSSLTEDTYYVFEYFSVYTLASGTIAEGGKYYTISNGSYTENTAGSGGVTADGTQYIKNTSDIKKTYKVIKVKNS